MRERHIENVIPVGLNFNDYGAQSVAYAVDSRYDQAQIVSSGHPDFRNPGSKDSGGPFRLDYNVIQNSFVNVGTIQAYGPYHEYHYTGMMGTNINMFGHEGIPYESPSGYGAECYSKMKPDRSLMPGLNAIYELKDVPGLLKQRFELNGLHEIGDYYLALKFGWQPLLTDCINFVLTHINAQKVLKQLLRDEGKPVRRRIDLFDIFSDPDITSGGGDLVPLLVTYFYSAPGTYTNQVRSRDHLWASARFRYWLPPGPRDVLWTAKMKARIFGFKPTPRVVYNAIPWSWLVDWFSHIGYMIDNLDTTLVDRLAADYFYVMRNKEWIASQTVTSHLRRDQTLEPFAVTAVGTHRRGFKCREHGDPFGWATPETSLSGVQLSILGALGLSRLR